MANEKEKEALSPTYNDSDGKGDGNATMDGSDLDSSKVKFINSGNGDPEANVKVKRGNEDIFVGLTKEELQKYAEDPYWVRIRWILLILFWVLWCGMLVAAILIIVLAEKCPHRPKQEWFEKSVVYQCYPRSFKDSNADGVGDLNGIHKKLDYLKDKLSVSSVMINPVYPSMDKDFGYDVTDYTAIHPKMGTMADFENLRVAMHKKGMKIIMDFVPNHTSKNHTWFHESRAAGSDPNNKYHDYYIWHAGVGGNPPNNWKNVMGDSAWTLDDVRNEYYYHQFLPDQPDLNLRNPEVKKELENVLKFWLNKKVDGFRIDAAAHLFESIDVDQNEKPASGTGYESLNHTLTTFQPESFELMSEWRALLDTYGKDGESYRFLIAEVYAHQRSMEEIGNFYEYKGKKVTDMPTNMNLLELDTSCDGNCVHGLVKDWLNVVPQGKTSNWMVGNHDKHRMATRVGENRVNVVSMLLLTLPGTPLTYYGDEIGMVNGVIDYADGQDKWMPESDYATKSRDFERTPMQWSNELNAGFSEANKTWLPVNTDYEGRNVKIQFAHGAGFTNIEVFKTLTGIRQEPSFLWGEFDYGVLDASIFSYVRQADRFDGYAVIMNFGSGSNLVNLAGTVPDKVPNKATIVAHTANFAGSHRTKEYSIGAEVNLHSFVLGPSEGIVVQWGWDTPRAKDA